MEYHMLYVESRKSFKVRREKKLVSLSSAKQIHSTNIFLCPVLNNYTRQTYFFAECLVLPSVFFLVYRVSNFAECFLHRLLSAFILPSVFFTALDKGLVCRVPEEMHSANIKTLGKQSVSGSVCSSCLVLLRLEGEPFINTGDQKRSARSCRMEDEV